MSRIIRSVLVAVALVASMAIAVPSPAAAQTVNEGCAAGFTPLKIDRAPVEGEVITDGTLVVTITDVDFKVDGSGEAFGFDYSASGASTVYVIVKGGPVTVTYGPGRTTNLDTVLGPGGRHYGISFVVFCYKV